MRKKRPAFPMEVSAGAFTVKICRVQNKGATRSTVSNFASGKVEVVELRSKERGAYLHALDALRPTGMALDLAATK